MQESCEAVHGARSLVDLFAGIGTLSLPLVAKGVQILVVEQDRAALAALKDGADAAGRGGQAAVRLIWRCSLTAADLAGFDAVILTRRAAVPAPNALCWRAVRCRALSWFLATGELRPRCGAACRWRPWLGWVQVIDQFRMSNHIELVARFSRI